MRLLKPISLTFALGGILCSAPSFADPPSSSGIVTRYEIPVGGFISDTKTDLTVTFGSDIRKICNGMFDADVYSTQDINPPNGKRLIYVAEGQVRVWVWPFSLEQFSCVPFFENEPIASGDGLLKDRGSIDLSPAPPSVSRFGFTVTGTVYDEVGNPADLRAIAQVLVFDGGEVREALARVRLRF